MQRNYHSIQRRAYALAVCFFILATTAGAQLGSQSLNHSSESRPLTEGQSNSAAARKARSTKPRLEVTEARLAGSVGVRQRISNTITTPCEVNPKNPSPPTFPEFPECKYARRGQECVIKVDRDKLAAVGGQEVASGTAVHVLVFHKSPFEKVRFDSERKEVAPLPNPVSGLISLISGAAVGITGAKTALATFKAGCIPIPPPPSQYVDQLRLEAMIQILLQRMGDRLQEIERVRRAYDKLAEDLDRFFHKDFCQPNDPARISGDFEADRRNWVKQICEDVTSVAPLTTDGEDQLLKDIGELFKKIVLDTASKQDCVDSETTQISQASGAVRLLRDAIANLDEARKQFTDIRNKLIDLEGAQCFKDLPQVADRQADIVGNLVFTNVITGKDDDKKLFTKVSFRDAPRAVLSAGILISSLEKRKFTVLPVFDGPGATATDPAQTHLEIQAETSKPQVVPFTFINIRLADWKIGKRAFTFNFAPGVGINANNGTTETEFALGPSFGIGGVYVFGGAHFGREPQLINGFNPSDRVPANFVAPVGRSWKSGFGFGISYRLPLP